MTIPDRREAAHLLCSLDPPDWFARHACVVADVAAWLARRASRAGAVVDLRLVEAAALLHDVDKLPAVQLPGHHRHGEGSAAYLAAQGWSELGPVVRDHPVTFLAGPDGAMWLESAGLEARIVAYADKRGSQRLEPMSTRFASWRRRYPPGSGTHVPRTGGTAWTEATMALAEARASALERDVCEVARVRPDEVRRLRWAGRTLREVAR